MGEENGFLEFKNNFHKKLKRNNNGLWAPSHASQIFTQFSTRACVGGERGEAAMLLFFSDASSLC